MDSLLLAVAACQGRTKEEDFCVVYYNYELLNFELYLFFTIWAVNVASATTWSPTKI